jgi:hypothetical protein
MQSTKTLKEFINELCKEHGIDVVTEVVRERLEKYFRLQELGQTANRMGLVSHMKENVEIKGRQN